MKDEPICLGALVLPEGATDAQIAEILAEARERGQAMDSAKAAETARRRNRQADREAGQ
jgi:hypothetical protein